MKYEKHIFVCANQKAEGKKCCGEAFGMEAVQHLRSRIKQANLQVEIRAQKAGCLDVCQHGPALVIYPEGTFYGSLTMENLDQIFDSHILKGEKIKSLELKF
jgi:(2Fe-2S) ferredoxin